jgi:DNA adenine methylase
MFFTACYNQPFVMILRRLGNKQKIAKEIQKHFPQHRIYIEPFFGAGGMFFNKPKANYNIVNDIDNDVFNLFNVATNNRNELKEAFKLMPIHAGLLDYWKENEETDTIKKALRFIFLSNFTYLGTGQQMRFTATKNEYPENFEYLLDATAKYLFGVQFGNTDFRKFIKDISFQTDGRNDEAKTLIYADPPYISTNDNYSHSFTEQDSIDLFDTLQNSKCMFAMSEFDNEIILNQAKERRLNVIYIVERTNLKNKRTEILVTNYQKAPTLF